MLLHFGKGRSWLPLVAVQSSFKFCSPVGSRCRRSLPSLLSSSLSRRCERKFTSLRRRLYENPSEEIINEKISSPSVPLTVEYPGTPKSIYSSPLQVGSAESVQVSTLPNGLRVATQETYQQATAIALFIDCGTIFENDDNHGICHVLERMAFKATKFRSTRQFVRELEDLGGNIMSSSSREAMLFSADVVRFNVPKTVELLADGVISPVFDMNDLLEQRKMLENEIKEMDENRESTLSEILHSIAFSKQPLGRSMLITRDAIEKISTEQLLKFHKRFYRPERMILSAAGIEHSQMVELAERWFRLEPFESALSLAHPESPPRSVYSGGEMRIVAQEPPKEGERDPTRKWLSHVIIAFESCGINDPDIYAISTLNVFLGGGGSFSSGGPGKGMYSRLYRHVLNGNAFVESAITFSSSFRDTGIFGVDATVEQSEDTEYLSQTMELVIQELINVSENIEPIELLRAKNQLKSSMLMGLESRSVLADDIGRQLLFYGKRFPLEFVCEQIDKLTVDDLKNVLRRMLRSKPTLLTYARPRTLQTIPSVQKLHEYFKTYVSSG